MLESFDVYQETKTRSFFLSLEPCIFLFMKFLKRNSLTLAFALGIITNSAWADDEERTAWETTKQVATAAAFVPIYIAAPAILLGTGAVLLVGKITYDAGMLTYNVGKASYQLAEYAISGPDEEASD